MIKYRDITVGCDPEFELVKGRTFIDLEYEDVYEYLSDCSEEIGDDMYCVELRPKCHVSAKGLVNNFKKLSREVHERGFKLSIAGQREPLGGHIHIGSLKRDAICQIKGNVKVDYGEEEFDENRDRRELFKALDSFLGSKVQCLSDPNRSDNNYGELGDVRLQEHGIEYRTPPSSIFYRPKLAKLCLMIAKRVTYFWINGQLGNPPENPKKADYEKYLKLKPKYYKMFLREIYITKRAMNRASKKDTYLGVTIK